MAGTLVKRMAAFLEADNWPLTDRTEQSFRTSYQNDYGSFRLHVQTREELQLIVMYTWYPVAVPKEQRSRAAEYMTRVNYGLALGNLEMDFSDGEVRFKTALDFEGTEFQDVTLRNFLNSNVFPASRFFAGLMKVVQEGMDPEEAAASAES